jgi:hypothetical protein
MFLCEISSRKVEKEEGQEAIAPEVSVRLRFAVL